MVKREGVCSTAMRQCTLMLGAVGAPASGFRRADKPGLTGTVDCRHAGAFYRLGNGIEPL